MKKAKKTVQQSINKLAQIRDKRNETYLEVIEFPVNDNERRQLELPPSVVNDPRSFEKHLRDKGAQLPKESVREFLQAVAAQDCPKRFVYEARTGWSDDRAIFVLSDGAIGRNAQRIRGINHGFTSDDETGQMTRVGTWQGWKAGVAKNASFSSLLVFGACVAFAAPLLAIAGEGSFSICIFGPTRTGKTVATLIASSVIGIGRSEDLIAWNITKARLDQRLAEYNDSVFPIDDFESIEGDDRTKYTDIRSLAYRLAQGVGKARSSVYNQSTGASNARWRCIALTSSEKSIQEVAKRAGKERQPGEALRLIDVPALVDAEDHIFDRLPTDLELANAAQWKTATFTAIREACARNHGEALRHYIEFLLKEGSGLDASVKESKELFMRAVADSGDDGQTRDVARKFALIFAGGIMASKAKLVDWVEKDILDAVVKFYVAARKMLPNEGELRREGIALLKAKIASLKTVPLFKGYKAEKGSFADWDGFTKNIWGKKTCIIKRDVFDSVFVSRPQRNLVERWLIENGLITLAQPKKAVGGTEARPKEQHAWPDGERRRSFEIKWRSDLNDGKAH